jgi:hypothetical protein
MVKKRRPHWRQMCGRWNNGDYQGSDWWPAGPRAGNELRCRRDENADTATWRKLLPEMIFLDLVPALLQHGSRSATRLNSNTGSLRAGQTSRRSNERQRQSGDQERLLQPWFCGARDLRTTRTPPRTGSSSSKLHVPRMLLVNSKGADHGQRLPRQGEHWSSGGGVRWNW